MSVYRSKFRPGNVKDKPNFLTSPLKLFLSPGGSGDLGPPGEASGPICVSVLVNWPSSHGRELGVPCGFLRSLGWVVG